MVAPYPPSGHRASCSSHRWLAAMGALFLSLTFATGDAVAQDTTVAKDPQPKAKPRPRLLGRPSNGTAAPGADAAPRPPAPGPKPPTTLAGKDPAPGTVDPAVIPAQIADQGGYSYQNLSNVAIGSQADQPFLRRIINSYIDEPTSPEPPDPSAPPTRRGMEAPFKAPPMPFSDFIGPVVGVNDTSVFPLMDAFYRGPNGQAWKNSRVKIYGWTDASYNASTSRNSNIPLAYNIVPNSLQLSQQIVIFERPLETAQTDHFDWGFRFTNLYGIDYRYTTAKGYFSDQLLKHNHLYGYDPLQLHLDFYFPHVFDGTTMRLGRYISPLDIEAQLSPDNFL